MSTLMLDGTAAASKPAAQRSKADALRIAALALLSIRFIQGFIYWGGGSRRFIYAPAKLDPNASSWMANKFQSAMPGALLGTDHIIGFLLHHFYLLYASLILFSAVELIAGLCLMTGFLTRAAALVSIGLSVVLMLMFGWQGATCIDEWTMAALPPEWGELMFPSGIRLQSRAYSATGSYPRIIRAGQSSCVVFAPFHRGAWLWRTTPGPKVWRRYAPALCSHE
jgi:uncharacterized membrane protein YphA (DoxX/SURF4 family)